MFYSELADVLQRAIVSLGFGDVPVELAHPTDRSHGDLTTSIALVLAPTLDRSPRDIAEAIVAGVDAPPYIDRFEVAGPGFINIYLSREFFRKATESILSLGDVWGKGTALAGRRIMVEHSQPNPFKPFHIGHLMSNTLGESISRLIEWSGAEVRRVNYQGDVGLHVAKALWGLAHLKGDPTSIEDLGSAYVEGNRAYEEDEGARAEIVAYNKLVYAHAPEITDTYTKGREASLAHFEELYALLGSRFDHYFFESETAEPGRALVKEGLARGTFTESEGAIVFRGEAYGLHTRVFITKDGLPTYEAKELGLAYKKREKWEFDLSITTTAVEQKEYMRVVYKALSLLNPALGEKLLHVPHGMLLLTSGKMSSRRGNVITGESLLSEMRARAWEKVKDRDLPPLERDTIRDAVAVAAIKYSILKQKAGKNIIFDPDASLSFEGDSGPYLQYAHTRAVSVLEKADAEGVVAFCEVPLPEVTDLERLLYRFPEVVARATEEFEPHHVTTYLTELAGVWNSWYAAERILDGSSFAPYKVALATAFAHTMKNGLCLLGIEAPRRM